MQYRSKNISASMQYSAECSILLNATPTHKLNAVDMSCDVRMFDAKVVWHTHTQESQMKYVSCHVIAYCILCMTTLAWPSLVCSWWWAWVLHCMFAPQLCVYSTASYFVFDDKLDKHTQVFLTTNCGSPTIVSIVGAPTLVLKTFAQLNTQHFVLGVRYTSHPHPHRITPNQCKQL